MKALLIFSASARALIEAYVDLTRRLPAPAPVISPLSLVPLKHALAGLSHDCPGDVGHRHFGTAR